MADVALAPEAWPDIEPEVCGLGDYPVEIPTYIQAGIASHAAGETNQRLSHMVLVRYRLDERGRLTHLKLMRPSSYGVAATDQALSLLKTRAFSPAVIDNKAMPACFDAAVTIHLR